MEKEMCWLDWAGDIAFRKEMQPYYYFNLEPVFVGDGSGTISGFSTSRYKSMKEERYATR
jgi:hypothetical protein